MKINNPAKFFPENSSEANYSKSKHRSTIVTRGDIIKLYARTDSPHAVDWHITPQSDDNWWKISFDGRTIISN